VRCVCARVVVLRCVVCVWMLPCILNKVRSPSFFPLPCLPHRYFHELAHTDLQSATPTLGQECTAIVAQDATGAVLHGGNMDQSPASVRNVTLQLEFHDALSIGQGRKQPLFRAVDWYWFTTGATRAVRKSVASLQENWRSVALRPHAEVFAEIKRGILPQVWVFRHALQTQPPPSWTQLLHTLSTTPLAAPFYIAAAGPGPGQGTIITRNLTGAIQVSTLSPPTRALGGEGEKTGREGEKGGDSEATWFLAQTNYDRFANGTDSPTDPRRTAAEIVLRRVEQDEGSTGLGLMAVLSTYPVHNPHSAYTAIMDPASGALHAYVRQALCPATPGNSVVQDARYCIASP